MNANVLFGYLRSFAAYPAVYEKSLRLRTSYCNISIEKWIFLELEDISKNYPAHRR